MKKEFYCNQSFMTDSNKFGQALIANKKYHER